EAAAAIRGPHGADGAAAKLETIAGLKLPAVMEGLRWLTEAMVRLKRGQYADALEALDRAQQHHPKLPLANLLRAAANRQLAQLDKALRCLDAYREQVGEDATAWFPAGEILVELWRYPEAVAAYRKSLDDDPTSAKVFRQLLLTPVPDETKGDLGA